LIELLDEEIQDTNDDSAYEWWRNQPISGAGVPEHVVPDGWKMPSWTITGPFFIPEKSLEVGPVYLAGDCLSSGSSMKLPWLFIITMIGIGCNLSDIYLKYTASSENHQPIDYVWLCAIGLCNLVPLAAGRLLFETRADCSYAVRPLLATRAIRTGVKIAIIGDDNNTVVQHLKHFLNEIGHLMSQEDLEHCQRTKEPFLAVYVMGTKQERDKWFDFDKSIGEPFDKNFSIFIWSGKVDKDGPFSRDQPGQNMMRFLVLVKEWDRANLADNLFSALGTRVVALVHEHAPSNT